MARAADDDGTRWESVRASRSRSASDFFFFKYIHHPTIHQHRHRVVQTRSRERVGGILHDEWNGENGQLGCCDWEDGWSMMCDRKAICLCDHTKNWGLMCSFASVHTITSQLSENVRCAVKIAIGWIHMSTSVCAPKGNRVGETQPLESSERFVL